MRQDRSGTLRRVTLRFGSSHAPASQVLESQDVAVNFGVHSYFHEIGLDPYQYHRSFTSFCTMFYANAFGLCNDTAAGLLNHVCAFMSWDRRRVVRFRNGIVTAEIVPDCGAARFARLRGLSPRSQ